MKEEERSGEREYKGKRKSQQEGHWSIKMLTRERKNITEGLMANEGKEKDRKR